VDVVQSAVAFAPPRRLRVLVATAVLFAALCTAAALLWLPSVEQPVWWAAAGSFLLIALSRRYRLRLQLGTNATLLDWGEAALIVSLTLLDLPWLILISAAGLTVGYVWSGSQGIKLVFNVAASVIATTFAGLVLIVMDVYRPELFRLWDVAALALAAIVSAAFTDVASSAAAGISRAVPISSMVADGMSSKLIGLISNLSVGFGALVVAAVNVPLLLLLPPIVWLLHQGYAGRVRARVERRTWQQLAAATHDVGQLNVADVTDAAIRGAARLFCADVVEIELTGPTGALLTRGNASGELWRGSPDVARPEPSVFAMPIHGGGDEPLGEIRLCFRDEITLGERERLALSTFTDSVASALRNADIHEKLRSIADRKAYEAAHDSLTQLFNRAHLMDAGTRELALTAHSSGAVALLLLDFDHFKEVNDTLGHEAGDQLLHEAAGLLAAATVPGESLARLGGDEFAVLIPVDGDAPVAVSYATARAAALLRAVAEPIQIGQIQLVVRASVGVAVTERGGCDIAELLRRADVAMYQAKRTAQPVVSYDPAKDAASLDRLALVTEMQGALDQGGQLVLHLQPSIDLADGAPLGAEALIRWQHPRRGLLTPNDFIPQIEQTDLIGPLTSAILDLALAACASWATVGLELPVAVNLSARSLLDRELPQRVATMLARHDIPPHQLVLEITETAMMSELEIVEDVVDALRGMGVQLALDDFGTGYSSLTFLARVKVDEVKIDQGFVANMHASPEAAAIVRTTIELARSLGLRVIAEGVENGDQATVLAQLGCTGAQGYHLYPPMAPEKARAAMAIAAQAAASHSSATVIPLGPKRAPWLGKRRPLEGESAFDDPEESVSERD
jgi:diguanylate cyclase (GGDEF)-like protein